MAWVAMSHALGRKHAPGWGFLCRRDLRGRAGVAQGAPKVLRVPTSRNVAQIRPRIYGFGEVRPVATRCHPPVPPDDHHRGRLWRDLSAAVRPPSRRGLTRRALATTLPSPVPVELSPVDAGGAVRRRTEAGVAHR